MLDTVLLRTRPQRNRRSVIHTIATTLGDQQGLFCTAMESVTQAGAFVVGSRVQVRSVGKTGRAATVEFVIDEELGEKIVAVAAALERDKDVAAGSHETVPEAYDLDTGHLTIFPTSGWRRPFLEGDLPTSFHGGPPYILQQTYVQYLPPAKQCGPKFLRDNIETVDGRLMSIGNMFSGEFADAIAPGPKWAEYRMAAVIRAADGNLEHLQSQIVEAPSGRELRLIELVATFNVFGQKQVAYGLLHGLSLLFNLKRGSSIVE